MDWIAVLVSIETASAIW
nr:TPA_asm: m102.3 sORF 2 [Murid betaherpesvirus 1]DBA08047.1 TPA_asm: m102.3 sORF 2 [Murid betaherpesvirus 1]